MLSVLIATHNGSDTLERTLSAMSSCTPPKDGWELIVVNNASTDDTKELVLKWRNILPLKYMEQPRLGKPFAINLALEHSSGDLIIMTDDDVLPLHNWLTEWRRVADEYPECSVFGGAIVPEFSSPPPAYVPKDCYGVLYGGSPQYVEGPLKPCDNGLFEVSGGNFAVRRAVYEGGGKFDLNFQIGLNGLMGEDTEFVRRLGTNKYKVCFTPNASVGHIIHKHQTSWRWIHKRFYRHGHCLFALMEARRNESTGEYDFQFPWRRLYSATGSFLRLLLAATKRDTLGAFQQSHGLAYDLGAIHQALIMLNPRRFLKHRA